MNALRTKKKKNDDDIATLSAVSRATSKKYLDGTGLGHLSSLIISFVRNYAAAKTHNHDGVYAKSSHTHSADNITSGTLPIGRGGTGSGNRTSALYNIVTGETVGTSTDWNSITRGYHMVTQGTDFTADKHAPVGMYTYGYMLSMDKFQIYVAHNGGIAHRQFWNNAWTKWITSFDEKSVIPIVNGGTGATTAKQAQVNLLKNDMPVASSLPYDDSCFAFAEQPGNENATNGVLYRRRAKDVWTYFNNKIKSLYLPLTGGTMSGQIKHPGSGCIWVVGRNSAVLRTTTSNSTDYKPIISGKTYQGSWDLGTYVNENLHLSYITDANYNAGTNEQTANIIFSPDSSITASAFKGNLYGNASTANLATAVKDAGDGRTLKINYSADAPTNVEWFAVWNNGGTLQSMNKNTVRGVIGAAASSHTHNYAGSSSAGGIANESVKLCVHDTRNDNYAPNNSGFKKNALSVDFKYITKINSPTGFAGTYCGLLSFAPWSDASGGNGYQMAFGYNGNTNPRLAIRTADLSATTWGGWHKIYTSADKPTPADIGAAASSHSHAWSDITGKPSTFTPSSHSHTASQISDLKSYLLNNVYKVGYVWISYTNTSPASIIGGSWVAITGRFPYFNAGTSVGGSNTHAHTLNSGYAKITSGGSAVLFNYKNVNTFNTNWAVNGSANGVSSSSVTTATTLGGNTDSNYHMPAYQELYAWRRTA